jgi:hypothetical protein
MRHLAILISAAMLAAVGCRTAPVRNVERTAFSVAPPAEMAKISEAIWAAGRREGWRVRELGPGEIRAEKSVRNHRALVTIQYDTAGFDVRLVEAEGLLYDGRYVHKVCNEWIEQLAASIQDEVRFRFG